MPAIACDRGTTTSLALAMRAVGLRGPPRARPVAWRGVAWRVDWRVGGPLAVQRTPYVCAHVV